MPRLSKLDKANLDELEAVKELLSDTGAAVFGVTINSVGGRARGSIRVFNDDGPDEVVSFERYSGTWLKGLLTERRELLAKVEDLEYHMVYQE